MSILDLLFPRRCPFCGKPVGKKLLCDSCREMLQRKEPGVITLQGMRCVSPLFYEGNERRAILRYKFNRAYGKKGPVLSYVSSEPCEAPKQEVATFY